MEQGPQEKDCSPDSFSESNIFRELSQPVTNIIDTIFDECDVEAKGHCSADEGDQTTQSEMAKKEPTSESVADTARSQRRPAVAKRLNLFLQVRVLFKILERNGEDDIRKDAQQAVKTCQNRNKAGDPGYASLAASIEREMRSVVGDRWWHQAELCSAVVLSKKAAIASHPAS